MTWGTLSEQAARIIDNIDGLTDQDIEEVYDEWSEYRFDRGIGGETQALTVLQQLATKKLLLKMGRWEAYCEAIARKGQ